MPDLFGQCQPLFKTVPFSGRQQRCQLRHRPEGPGHLGCHIRPYRERQRPASGKGFGHQGRVHPDRGQEVVVYRLGLARVPFLALSGRAQVADAGDRGSVEPEGQADRWRGLPPFLGCQQHGLAVEGTLGRSGTVPHQR